MTDRRRVAEIMRRFDVLERFKPGMAAPSAPLPSPSRPALADPHVAAAERLIEAGRKRRAEVGLRAPRLPLRATGESCRMRPQIKDTRREGGPASRRAPAVESIVNPNCLARRDP